MNASSHACYMFIQSYLNLSAIVILVYEGMRKSQITQLNTRLLTFWMTKYNNEWQTKCGSNKCWSRCHQEGGTKEDQELDGRKGSRMQ
jgi:hypothetical protein